MRHRFKILVGQDRTGNCRDLNTTKSPPRSDRRAGSWDAPGVADAWSLPSRFDVGLELWETGGWRYTFQCAISFGCFWSGFTVGRHLIQFLVVLLFFVFFVFDLLFAFVVVVVVVAAAATVAVGSGILFIVLWFLAMVVFCGVFFLLPLVMLAKQFAPPCFARDGYRWCWVFNDILKYI